MRKTRKDEDPTELRVDNLSVDFNGFRALSGVSLSARGGERHALIGPNGAGKTTMMNAIGGAINPTEGEIALDGELITGVPEHRRAALGIARTYQITNLFEGLSVVENVYLSLLGQDRARWTAHRSWKRYEDMWTRARETARQVGLGSRLWDKVHSLSHGEKRQLELALGLVVEPSVLLLDEPAAGLSDAERRHLLDLIAAIPRDVAVLLVEHNMDLVLAVAEFITVLDHGTVIAHGPPEQVRNDENVRRAYLGHG